MKSISLLVFLFFIWPFSSAKTFHMAASNSVPAASGTVKVEKGNANGNTDLDIKVSNLARPTNLVPADTVYIVWVRPSGEAAIKKGAIGVDNNLHGESKVVTTSKNFDLFITAERSESVTAPSGLEVLHTHVTLG